MTDYQESIDYLYRLQWHGIRPGLERMALLLVALGDPQRKFKSVHVGGTNGKGSTAALLASVLQQGGYRVGLYTSPHLIDFSERIRIGGIPISESELVHLTQMLRGRIEALGLADQITFFELTTAMAFVYFAQLQVDWAVVEVGLGGRFDATNLLVPEVSAITHIDLDHENFLGYTLLEIAREKAGIIKMETPVVTGASQPEVLACFAEMAQSKRAPLLRLGHEMTVQGDSPRKFRYRGVQTWEVECPLPGRHQIANCAVALGVIEQLREKGFPLIDTDILEGIRKTRWEGRLSMVRQRPLILLDGAHNPAGARALAAYLTEVDSARCGVHWMVVGMMRDKDGSGILAPLIPWADEVVLTRPNVERGADPAAWIPCLRNAPAAILPHLPDAIAHVESRLKPEDTLLITGSLYVVGEAAAYFEGRTPSLLRG
jgi:dihydrofolate synthase/folylpolyglutamate synthase